MPIEIDKASGLSVPDAGPGNRERFAAIFQLVWASIPPRYREQIVAYWKKFRDRPVIDMLSRFRFPGENEDYGCIVKFNAEAADWMADNWLAGLIAHELGHVWHYSNPTSESNRPARIEVLTPIKEREADTLATEWGYDMKELRAWANYPATRTKLREFGCDFPEGAAY